MASWFFGHETNGITRGAFYRAITTSFGSICFGSFIEGFIRTLQGILRMLRNKSSDNAFCLLFLSCVECILQLLGDLLEWFNDYCYVQIAVYGKSYIQSAKDTWELFKSKGVTAFVNDDLTGLPLMVGGILCSVLVTAVCLLVGGVYRKKVDEKTIAPMFLAIVIGCTIFFGTVRVIKSYTKTLFVCWVEQPQTMLEIRPSYFAMLVEAAQKMEHSTAFCQERNGSV